MSRNIPLPRPSKEKRRPQTSCCPYLRLCALVHLSPRPYVTLPYHPGS